MKVKQTDYYDWFEDFEPEVLKNLNDLLAAKGVDPVGDLHGGWLADNIEWRGVGSGEYVNFWHAYLDVWGEQIRNDSYVVTYFPPDDQAEWDYCKELIEKNNRNKLATLIVDAVQKVVKDNGLYDKHGDCKPTTIWFSW